MKTINIDNLNIEFQDKSPEQIIAKALSLSKKSVLTTNFRPYEVAIIDACTSLSPNMAVIWCDTGYNTPQTYKHATNLIERFNLNIHLYVPKQSVAYRNTIMGIPDISDENHSLFTQQVKLEPFQRAMAEHQPDVWFTNIRRGQTEFRNNANIFTYSKDGLLKVSPFYHWSDNQLDTYLQERDLPNEFTYFDPTKVLSNRECGLHS